MDSLSTSPLSPPDWSLLAGDLGRWSILLATIFFGLTVGLWLLEPRYPRLRPFAARSFIAACLGLFASFAALGSLFVGNRFEYEYVWGHADSLNTVPYRIAGIWSGQEGSFLLWACSAAVFGLAAVGMTGVYRRWYTIAYATFLGAIANILVFESPFDLIRSDGQVVVPVEGVGLAPSLQNYWVTIHPPTIFLGFGSLTVLFALAFAALCRKDYETWIPLVRPWTILSVTLVGLGLCMGGFWAYETLGWGGFWMWDPVENVSFVPWCFGAAFLHGVIVQATKKRWQMGNLLMAGLPFIAFVYGTFLTRSGMLSETSVHSFAEMDRSALKLLIAVMAITTGGFLAMWFTRLAQFKREAPAEDEGRGVRREGFYLSGIILLIAMGLATAIGMSVPFFLALAGKPSKVVEEHLYHQVLPWVFIPLMAVLAVTPFVRWRRMPAREVLGKAYTLACIAVAITGVALFASVVTSYGQTLNLSGTMTFPGGLEIKGLPWMLFLIWLCSFVLVGNLWQIAELAKRSKLGVSPFLAHVGIGVLMAGLIVSRGFEQKEQTIVMEGHPGRALSYGIRFAGLTSHDKDRNNKVRLEFVDLKKPDKTLFTATPGYYLSVAPDGRENPMVWPSIHRGVLYDTYVSLAPPQTEASEQLDMTVGKTIVFSGITIRYLGLKMLGQPGQSGTRFAADLEVTALGETKRVAPALELTGSGTIQHPAPLDEALQVALVSMDAADKHVVLQIQLISPMYPVEVYHKPMTGLVWLGTGLLTLGGLLAAFYRRAPKKALDKAQEKEPARTPLVPSLRRQYK